MSPPAHLLLICTVAPCLACVSAPSEPPRWSVLAAHISDVSGGVWSAEDAPRMPVITLTLSPPRSPSPGRVFWLQGLPDEELLEDLADPPLRERTQARLLGHALMATAGGARLQLDAPLSPGSRSTLLLWTGDVLGDAGLGWWQLPMRASTSPSGGAAWAASLPADGATSVSVATRRVLLRWDGFLRHLAETRAVLETAASGTISTAAPETFACADQGLPEGHCAWVPLPPLEPDTQYTLRLTGPLEDAGGAPLPTPRVTFRTGRSSGPPEVRPPACALDERPTPAGCARADRTYFILRTATRAPALVRLRQGARTAAAIATSGAVELRLPVGGPGEAALEVEDLTGRRTSVAVEVWLEPDLPRLRVLEVLAAPLGNDARSEYVEVVNDGDTILSTLGWSVTRDPDAQGRHVLGAAEIGPGGRALWVGPSFDPSGFVDLPAGLPRVALDGSLSLSDQGGPLIVRDARGRRVEALQLPESADGRCVLRDEAPGAPAWVGACRHTEVRSP